MYDLCPIKVALANSVDLDQIPQNAASDLSLHCLHLKIGISIKQ